MLVPEHIYKSKVEMAVIWVKEDPVVSFVCLHSSQTGQSEPNKPLKKGEKCYIFRNLGKVLEKTAASDNSSTLRYL